jgi:hypothetical protein
MRQGEHLGRGRTFLFRFEYQRQPAVISDTRMSWAVDESLMVITRLVEPGIWWGDGNRGGWCRPPSAHYGYAASRVPYLHRTTLLTTSTKRNNPVSFSRFRTYGNMFSVLKHHLRRESAACLTRNQSFDSRHMAFNDTVTANRYSNHSFHSCHVPSSSCHVPSSSCHVPSSMKLCNIHSWLNRCGATSR